jgi:hypothetical protein
MTNRTRIAIQLQDAISRCGKPLLRVAQEAGVQQPALWHFMKGRDIRLETAQKLIDYFGLELHPRLPPPEPQGDQPATGAEPKRPKRIRSSPAKRKGKDKS